MNKKYLIIQGSARKNGALNEALQDILAVLKNDEVIVFDTYLENPVACDGCNYCEKKSKCKNRDLDDFYKAFEECDTIVFLGPIYNGFFPAPLKALIDRFQVYYTSFYKNGKVQAIKKHRDAVFIASAGRDGEKAFEYMKSALKCAFTILNVELKNSFLIKNTDTISDYSSHIEDIKRSLADD